MAAWTGLAAPASPSANPARQGDTSMKKSFWFPIAWASCGLPRAAPARAVRAPVAAHRQEARRDRVGQAQGGRAHHHDRGFTTRIESLEGEIDATQAPGPRPGQPRPPEGRAARGARPPGGRRATASSACARSSPPRAGSWRPAGGDLQGRHARRADRGPRGRRLRRPARARRVPRSHLRPGPRDHRRVRRLRDTAATRRWSSPSSRSASSSPRSASCASATRSPRRRASSSASRDQLASVRADKRGRLASVRDQPRRARG